MPPPTAADPWLASRRFGIVIDAGSSGSRLQIYSWLDPRAVKAKAGPAAYNSLPKVEKGAKNDQDWVTKVEPGISTFADDPEGAGPYLAPLLDHARTQILPSMHAETPIFLLATAGMRLLTQEQQAAVLTSACTFLRMHSHFRIDEPSALGPCGSSVRIITGEEEGLFGWIAVNYLMDGFSGPAEQPTTYGFLDMGGASTQIAFEPSASAGREHAKNLIDVRLRRLSGAEIHHQVFVTTWLGYGTNQARERYVAQAIDDFEAKRPANAPHGTSTEGEFIPDPCLPKDLSLTETPAHASTHVDAHNRRPHTLVGTGSFEHCLQRALPLLNKSAPCPVEPCLFNGVHAPPIDFSVAHFIGVSEYWYSSEHVFGLGGAYDFVQYERAASEFCARDWEDLVAQHATMREGGGLARIGGEGEVLAPGGDGGAQTGRWDPSVEIGRLQMQCFKAAWIANILHDGLGMPRLTDPGGNSTVGGHSAVEKHAAQKGLGRPIFQSVDRVADVAISWTLGKMVLEASKEVPAADIDAPPLVDPVDDLPDPDNAPFHLIRPFPDLKSIDDAIAGRLPALSRQSLGFSPFGFLFYVVVCGIVLSLLCRLRHRFRAVLRAWKRSPFMREREAASQGNLMEEGHALNGYPTSPQGSRPSSPGPKSMSWRRFQNILLPSSRPRAPYGPSRYRLNGLSPRNGQHSPGRLSPTRAYSAPVIQTALSPSSAARSGVQSRPSSPFLGPPDATSSFASSRNSSQISLSTLVPRQGGARFAPTR